MLLIILFLDWGNLKIADVGPEEFAFFAVIVAAPTCSRVDTNFAVPARIVACICHWRLLKIKIPVPINASHFGLGEGVYSRTIYGTPKYHFSRDIECVSI